MKEKVKNGLIGLGLAAMFAGMVVCAIESGKQEGERAQQEIGELGPMPTNPKDHYEYMQKLCLIGSTCFTDNSR